jgi:glycogen phosphorylase
VYEAREALRGKIPITYLENYDMLLAKKLCSGVDVWLNTPLPPLEASGTSGMKAALNGVPSLSILDGWWVEGHIEGVTGWAIDDHVINDEMDKLYAASLYSKLENEVLPCFYNDRERFIDIMRHAIALNGSFFSSQRMVWQYLHNTYKPRL